MKIQERTELMFSQAVALSQSGKMKSTIHVNGDQLFIINMDDTILMKFGMRQEFPAPVSFFANDYESPDIEMEDGKIVFVSTNGGYQKRQVCPSPKIGFVDVKEMWDKFSPTTEYSLMINSNMISLLADNLSHVELHRVGDQIKLLQKNIYSGARVEVSDTNAETGLFSLSNLPDDFQVIGIRTNDFKALFSFLDSITLYFQPGKNWMYFKDSNGIAEGIIGTCLYDELSHITGAE